MKNRLAALSVVACLAASPIHAEYVCQITLMPPVANPTMGQYGYVPFYTSAQPDCTGQTYYYVICSKGATNKECGVNEQYSEAALMAVYESLRSQEATQQTMVPYWNACINAGGDCIGGVLLNSWQ
jgi:hypothetical protein